MHWEWRAHEAVRKERAHVAAEDPFSVLSGRINGVPGCRIRTGRELAGSLCGGSPGFVPLVPQKDSRPLAAARFPVMHALRCRGRAFRGSIASSDAPWRHPCVGCLGPDESGPLDGGQRIRTFRGTIRNETCAVSWADSRPRTVVGRGRNRVVRPAPVSGNAPARDPGRFHLEPRIPRTGTGKRAKSRIPEVTGSRVRVPLQAFAKILLDALIISPRDLCSRGSDGRLAVAPIVREAGADVDRLRCNDDRTLAQQVRPV